MKPLRLNLTPEAARAWKPFVAGYVVALTSRKANRALVENYQVKRVAGGYKIFFGGRDAAYGVMSAETLYSWMERLPLVYYARQADALRVALLTRVVDGESRIIDDERART